MSSAGSAAAKVAQQTYQSAKTSRQRWIIKEAYPLYATIGLGCAGAILYLGRLALGPDTMWDKTRRAEGHKDRPDEYTKGEAHRNHFVRKFLHGKNTSILPDWKYTARQEADD